eukprot:CAMPEP_0203689166 /NCGR_PEP_ID=MMETSP0091-20130426/1555_1 /ASSEMBLY_ACC=CAM_ASM_001089 /TAXON_ID=426623 /ORGANISM="Chaetoceros affinis, Strain CCMP159" /LENGTH=227 /DNA_ID=CAMNT_0050558743 /DNA_START=60 /DNA_END=743 /DNA_ORIENTATION=-
MYEAMPEQYDSTVEIDGYTNWTADEVADYFEKSGLGDYRETIIYHKITGKIAPQLNDGDLKDMGIEIVGDRCRFRQLIKTMSRKARHMQRNKIIWSGKEQLWFDCWEKCMGTCCGIFPEDPSTYKLTNNHLRVRTVDPLRVGPIRLCCCHKYHVNNIDLTTVEDVDMNGIPAPFLQQCLCFSSGKEILDVSITGEGSVSLILGEGEGETVSNLIMNQVEESQMIERD